MREPANESRDQQTIFGPIEIERSVYQHAGRGRLRIPMDARLGIIEGGYTPKLARVLTHGIAVMTEEDAAGFVAEVGLATVSSSTFHRIPRAIASMYEAKVTCDWLAWFVHQKFGLLAPLDRIRRDLAERGIPLAMGTLVNFVERAADLLAPVDGVHWKQLLAGSWMATDGTGLKVIIPRLPAAHDGYLELYRDDARAVFQYEPTKAGPDVVAKLAPFVGTLTADAEHRFNALTRPAA